VPLLLTRKEAFAWLKEGRKTVDVRKGHPRHGDMAVFQSGPNYLRFRIIKKETGKLTQIIRNDNYGQVVPSAEKLDDALNYLRNMYGGDGGEFTAYYLSPSHERLA